MIGQKIDELAVDLSSTKTSDWKILTKYQSDQKQRKTKLGFSSSYRDLFTSDRDRILYSKAFRRLRGKTQIFITGYDDHMRDRLSHSLEVAQLSREIARSLSLDSELCEAIALGHDVGHCPFGHAAERRLNKLMNHILTPEGCDKAVYFKHNWQSVRLLMNLVPSGVSLDTKNDQYGLALTGFTYWGILNHTKKLYKKTKTICSDYLKIEEKINNSYGSLEAHVVRIADEVAQIHHDFEDGIEGGIIDKTKYFKYLEKYIKDIDENERLKDLEIILNNLDKRQYLPTLSRFTIRLLLERLINQSKLQIKAFKKEHKTLISESLKSKPKREELRQIIANKPTLISFDGETNKKEQSFRKESLESIIVDAEMVAKMDHKGKKIINDLFQLYLEDTKFTNKCFLNKEKGRINSLFSPPKDLMTLTLEERARLIADHLSSMTDMYAQKTYLQSCVAFYNNT